MASTNPIDTLDEHIKSGNYSKIYLFCGEERYLVNQNLKKLLDALIPDRQNSMNFSSYTGTGCNVKSILSDIQTLPFLEDYRVTLVENSGFFDKGSEELKEALSRIESGNILIFSEVKLDKRTAIYKAAAKLGTVLEFSTPKDDQLLKWIQYHLGSSGLKVGNGVPERILSSVGNDMLLLSNEMEKLISYGLSSNTITVQDVEMLCSVDIEDKVFDMCDAIGLHDAPTVIKLYNNLTELRTPPMKTLSLVTRHYNILMQVKYMTEGFPKNPLHGEIKPANFGDIGKLAGIPQFTVKKYSSQAKKYTLHELIDCVNRCQAADISIKSGQATDISALEGLIVDLIQSGSSK